MASFKKHAVFGFWEKKYLLGTDPGSKGAMGSFGKLTTLSDLPGDKTLISHIKQAMQLNDEGVKRSRTTSSKRTPLRIPTYFRTALKNNTKALATFEGFSYSNKKDYVEWVTEAKTEETRSKRLATALEWMAEGKVRNWKYLR